MSDNATSEYRETADEQNSSHDPGPAESAQEAAAIMGFSDTNSAGDTPPVADSAAADTSGTPSAGSAVAGVAAAAAPIVDQAKQQAQKALEQTKSVAGDALGQAKSAAGDALGQAKQKTTSWIETQLDVAADSLHNVAGAVRSAGEQFGSQDPNFHQVAEVATSAANTVEGISSRLRDATVDEIIVETEGFARKQPSLFIGGVFALGFVLARFLKSTTGSVGSASASGDRLLPVPLDQEPQAGR